VVNIKYAGRTGNRMFTYSFARIIAERNNLSLETEWAHPEFIEATPFIGGAKYTKRPMVIRDLEPKEHDKPWHLEDLRQRKVLINGFFQFPDYYDANKSLVKSIWKTPPIYKRPPNEVVIHLRLGDYMDKGLRSVINPSWHQMILLKHLRLDPRRSDCKIYVVVENPNEDILKYYKWMNPTIVSNPNPKYDFEFIRSFDNIICSNSSFCWWAAFLSEATNIYTFEPWLQFPKNEHIKLAYMNGATPVQGGFYL